MIYFSNMFRGKMLLVSCFTLYSLGSGLGRTQYTSVGRYVPIKGDLISEYVWEIVG